MKAKNFGVLALSLLALMFLVSGISAATLAEWPLDATNLGVPTNVNMNVTANNLSFGSGIGAISYTSNRAASDGWTSTARDSNDYYQVSLTSKTGYAFTINSLSFNYYSTAVTGPTNWVLQYSKNSDFSSVTNITSVTITTFGSEVLYSNSSLSISVNEGETIYFRWFAFGGSTGNFGLSDVSVQGTTTTTLPSEIIDSNALGNPGHIEVKKIDFTDNGLSSGETFGGDSEWFPLEDIDAEIQIKNNGDYDVSNIEVDWGLWDTQNHQWVIEMNDEKDFDLKDGDTKTLTVSFSIDDKMDVDLEDKSLTDGDHYRFYVTATGAVDDSDSADDGEKTSANDFEQVSIVLESNFVVLDNFQVPATVSCGKTTTLVADIWNIGDEDQDDVSVKVYNQELGINEKVEVGDLDAFDRVSLNFDLKVPSDADEKSYNLEFTVYDEDNEVYTNDLNDDESVFTVPLTVKGSCIYATAGTTNVDVELNSGGKAGAPMVLTATVENTGNKAVDYTFNLEGYSSWASLSDMTPSSATLAPGQSQDIAITLNVNDNASGGKTFNFEVYSNGYLVTKQPLSATVTSGFSLTSITGGAIGNAVPLVIGLFSVVLVVAIIIVLVRLRRR